MRTTIWKQLAFPGGLLLLAATILLTLAPARNAVEPYLFIACGTLLAVGLVFAALYNRGRTALALLVIAAAAFALTSSTLSPKLSSLRVDLLTFLLPVNLLLLSLLREQGLRSAGILATTLLAAGQAAWLWLLPRFDTAPIRQLLATKVITGDWVWWTSLPQVALAAFVIALAGAATLFLWKRRPTDRALCWAIVAVFFGVHAVEQLAVAYFAAAALILSAGVLEHAYSVAYLDELTGIPGRRALNEFLPQVLGRMTVAMVDVDHFKKFNDTYGHDAGDQVLRLVARRLAAVKGGGRVFRYGGEEFTVVFPSLSKKEASPFLEALRASIEDPGFRLRGVKRPKRKPRERRFFPRDSKTVAVTVSIGVAERTSDFSGAGQLIAAADRALYRAKEGGRNQVCLAA